MKTVVVTGANRGIGLELCRQLAERGDDVVATCRRTSAELDALGVSVLHAIDVANPASIESLAKQLHGRTIDWLINNAGILSNETLDDLDFDRIRAQVEVNTLGPLRVTHALLPNLQRGSKVAIITSRAGSIGDGPGGGLYGYRLSKAAVNMVGANLARELKDRGIAVFLLHPGMVATEMTAGHGLPVTESVANLLARLDKLGIEDSGKFFHAKGEQLPW